MHYRRIFGLSLITSLLLVALMAPAAGAATPTNLVVNGSFEDPPLNSTQFLITGNIPGWTASVGEIEIQNNFPGAGGAAAGAQHAELGARSPSTIYQDVPTVVGGTYTLSFALRARPGTLLTDNRVGVSAGGAALGDVDATSVTTWAYHSFTIVATTATTRIAFADKGDNPNSLGTFIDDVSLTDTTPPVITPSVAGTQGDNGWYTSNVAVSWTVTDPDSAITSSDGCGPTTISADTADTTLTCTATSAGGTSSQSVAVKRDATAPTLAPTVAPNPVVLNGTATATPNASDSLSGVASSSCAPVVTSSAGAQSVACTATDNAGNVANANANYTVGYAVCALYDQTRAHKLGSTVPVKLQLCDANGANVSSAGTVVHASGLTKVDPTASAIVDDSGAANSPDDDFRYDAALGGTGGYIFNLSTKGLTTGTWQLSFTAGGATYTVQFDVK